MAFSQTIVCDDCKKKVHVYFDTRASRAPKTCNTCKSRQAAEAKQAYLHSLAALPIEERLSKIEEFMYDHQRTYHAARPVIFNLLL